MSGENYQKLLLELPSIAKAVKRFDSEALQVEAFKALVGALEGDSSQREEEASTKQKAPPKRKRKKAGGVAGAQEEGNASVTSAGVDINGLVDELKERPDAEAAQTAIFYKKDIWRKIAYVLFATKQKMTSGELAKVIRGLGSKADPSNISKCLKKNSGKLIQTAPRKKGGVIPRYELISKARKDMGAWLAENVT